MQLLSPPERKSRAIDSTLVPTESIKSRLWGAIPFAGVHVACIAVIWYPPTLGLVVLAAVGYVVRMWAVTTGYHRYFSHRTFRTSRAFQFVLALLGTTALQQGPLWWSSWHRRHHKNADRPGDPHTPRSGFWHAHVGWVFDGSHHGADLSNVKDLSAYPELRWLDRHHYVSVIGYALLCYAIAGMAGVIWGFVISSTVLVQITFMINSLAHRWGTRPYDTKDDSRNNAILALLTFGEGWHNNHHHEMTSARQGFRWWEIDLSYYSLRALGALGIVWNIREPRRAAQTSVALAERRREVDGVVAELLAHPVDGKSAPVVVVE
jgi:stearoyl-CoA desaturase (Delta-9 desaturase)